MNQRLRSAFAGRTVFLTGHTGFKGSWLALWLNMLGAKVVGFSLRPSTIPSLFELLGLQNSITHIVGDVRGKEDLASALVECKPEFVFHLAAQSLVRLSYDDPLGTFETNAMGTANLLEAVRSAPSVRVCLVITSDKCYENREWVYAYRENDPMGGYDPYSASKGCAELVTAAYRSSFFPPDRYQQHRVAIASARSGNVIGGGDWSRDRIVPDLVRALSRNEALPVRNPEAIRPWQHVLEPLAGYLALAAKMREDGPAYSSAYNFGPLAASNVTVKELVRQAICFWGAGGATASSSSSSNPPHEATFLKLDCTKALNTLPWQPRWSFSQALEQTISWYQGFYSDPDFSAQEKIRAQIRSYMESA